MEAYCFQAYAESLEVIPTTLAENAGLNPIAIVTELRNRHALGERTAGINVRKVSVCEREREIFEFSKAFVRPVFPESSHLDSFSSLSLFLRSQGQITNILEENVLQPLLVNTSAIELATETVSLLLRIDDYHLSR